MLNRIHPSTDEGDRAGAAEVQLLTLLYLGVLHWHGLVNQYWPDEYRAA